MGVKKTKAEVHAREVFHDYRFRSRIKNYFFDLTMEQLSKIIQKDCFYCAKPPAKSNSRRGKFRYNGLDRKNHNRGYTMDNVIPCCKECNGIRSNILTVEEMQVVARALKKYRSGAARTGKV